ncbi:glycosyl hydrolase-related protein, partial [candidate division KSB1 bacterium]|nr:glycosyl hydrolase-related protein [candidate division KSB1 bacterium]
TIKFDSVAGYFESLINSGAELPTVNDELQFIFPGCYTTHADIKLRNRRCENLFPVLEFFSLMAWPYEFAYPEFILDEGWERTCFNHFHDILPGSGIHAAYQETLPITDGILAAGEAALERGLRAIAEKIKTNLYPDKKPLVVFNPTNWDRTDIIQIRIDLKADEYIELWDNQKHLIPCQLTNRLPNESTLLFLAEAIPSMGYKTYWWQKCQKETEFPTDLNCLSEFEFENQFYRLKIDRNSGNILSLLEKENGREYIAAGQKGNVFQLFYEIPGEMSAWVIGEIERIVELTKPTRIDLLEKGPIRILMQITYHHGKSEFIQQIALYTQMRRIDFPCSVDWFEQGTRQESGPMLKVCFPIALKKEEVKATFDIPFGHIVRPANGAEVPAQKWIDVSNQHFGVGLLNDCKYGHAVDDNTMYLTLLRCSFEPDHEPDQGQQRFAYAIIPHGGSWKESMIDREGLAFNQPLRAIITQPRVGHLSTDESFVTVSAPNIIISAMKKGEEGSDSIILRFYESHGQPAAVEFKFAFRIKSVCETDMLERELENGQMLHLSDSFKTTLTPFEIKTVKIVREPFGWPKRHGFLPV